MCAHLRVEMPPLLRQVYWAAFGNPCCGVYQPFYLHGVGVPEGLSVGDNMYSPESPWWLTTRLRLACDLNYERLNPRIRETFSVTEQWEMERQLPRESKALELIQSGNRAAAQNLLRQFVDENFQRVSHELKALNESVPSELTKAGVDYLFQDYLRQWILDKKVPLELPK